jgi:hypothetical protein
MQRARESTSKTQDNGVRVSMSVCGGQGHGYGVTLRTPVSVMVAVIVRVSAGRTAAAAATRVAVPPCAVVVRARAGAVPVRRRTASRAWRTAAPCAAAAAAASRSRRIAVAVVVSRHGASWTRGLTLPSCRREDAGLSCPPVRSLLPYTAQLREVDSTRRPSTCSCSSGARGFRSHPTLVESHSDRSDADT